MVKEFTKTVGIIANPMSGRDGRRLAARASSVPHESKRLQITRAVVGAIAAGADHIVVVNEPRRISSGAVENLTLNAHFTYLDVNITHNAAETIDAVEQMKALDCKALIVLGGDGTNRIVAKAWPNAPIVPISTGTNNVFPLMVEATLGGMAAGLVASGKLPLEDAGQPSKVVRIEIEGEPEDVALIDAVFLINDIIGNAMPYESDSIRHIILARAEPASVGISPVGGLLCPSNAEDEFGVEVRCCDHGEGGKLLLAPISPGLFRSLHVKSAEKLELGKVVEITGPGILAFDGDRERVLEPGQKAYVRVVRDGPHVIDVHKTLQLAAERELLSGLGHWTDNYDGALKGIGCC
ncbi:MAG: NAD(+)/NADH kinase [Pseudomonadales bacterium]|nr:NAD(+)/NADH kinase [Pseudomonadales bacterium]